MSNTPPERITVSIPDSAEIDADQLDELVEHSEFSSRSEFIREAIRSHVDLPTE